MLTHYTIIPEIGEAKRLETQLSPKPGYDALRQLIEPHLDGERLEHVAVLFDDERRDLFVGECSSINGRMIRNIRATEIYRNNALRLRPDCDTESLPYVCGPAVLFPNRRVWF